MLSIKQASFCSKRLVSYIPRQKTHYEILEVDPKVSNAEIQKAFVEKSNRLHPDGRHFQHSAKGTEDFMALKEAYDVLRRPEKRKEYDRELEFGKNAARDMYYEADGSSSQGIDPNLINLNIRSPRSQLRPLRSRMSLSDRVGHFFDPAKAIAFEEIERRRIIYGAVDYYEVLGVPKTATSREIKSAFYKLSKQYHPDVPGADSAKFLEVKEAYDVLRDDNKRREYDTFGHGNAYHGQGQGYAGQNPFNQGFGQNYGGYQRVYKTNIDPHEYERIMREMDRVFKNFGARTGPAGQSTRFYGFKREFNQQEFDRIWNEMRKNTNNRQGPIFDEIFKRARERADAFHQQQNDQRWQTHSNEKKDREHWNYYQFKVENYIDVAKAHRYFRAFTMFCVGTVFILISFRNYLKEGRPNQDRSEVYDRQNIVNMMNKPPIDVKPEEMGLKREEMVVKPEKMGVKPKEEDPIRPYGMPESYSSFK
ncbi:unnamed protein product [Bursaphelenchus okinawaensis]|uniref:J domain-containing protein n=1 Tax=Bursaphelenchus okinawaensis TaxID=465554 RepID=A0A811L8P2_9BILA|nr:unnamed protein product [Bursaphelenchus okinawaensis]CAG9119107.1 unnamed protein product [Bursaphelenchus okinawaensis]